MNWIKIDEKLPEINQEVFLCDERDKILRFIYQGQLIRNPFYKDQDSEVLGFNINEEFHFDGEGWFGPQSISRYTHWMPKEIPKHVLDL